jgi:hypothetical protein
MEMLLGMIGMIVMLGVPAYFVAQPMALMRWQGRWRKLALMPLLLVIPAVAYSAYAFADGSNLWPMTLIAAAAIGTIYLGLLWLLQWWLLRG